MRATSLLLGALVLLPLAAEGQDSGPETTPRAVTIRPADVVAERVRSVLFGDPNRASLAELAEVIPETSIARSERVAAEVSQVEVDRPSADVPAADGTTADGTTDDATTAELPVTDDSDVDATIAAMLAELPPEVATPSGSVATDILDDAAATDDVLDVVALGPAWTSEGIVDEIETPTSAARIVSWGDRLRTVNVETLFRLLAGAVLLIAIATLLRRRGAGFVEKAVRGTRRGPVGDARSLVAKGVPLHEVTRRTGLGRDAVALLAHRKPS